MAATPNWRVNSIDSFHIASAGRISSAFRAALPVPKDRAANLASWSQCFDCTYGHVTLNRSFELGTLRHAGRHLPDCCHGLSGSMLMRIALPTQQTPKRLLQNDVCQVPLLSPRWKPGCTTKIGFAKWRLDKSFDHSIYSGRMNAEKIGKNVLHRGDCRSSPVERLPVRCPSAWSTNCQAVEILRSPSCFRRCSMVSRRRHADVEKGSQVAKEADRCREYGPYGCGGRKVLADIRPVCCRFGENLRHQIGAGRRIC